MRINTKQLMMEIGYSNNAQATKILGEPKTMITKEEAIRILDKIGAIKITSANKERVLKAQTILGNKTYLDYTDEVEAPVKKVSTTIKKAGVVTKKVDVENLHNVEIERYKASNKKLLDEISRLKAELLALEIGIKMMETTK
ncbi:MAG: hypothetical protein ACRC0V_10990 [Fusobacteriaceae bacterium]